MEIGFFRQFLLTPPHMLPTCSNILAEQLAVFLDFHDSIKEAETTYTDYRIYTVFYVALPADLAEGEDCDELYKFPESIFRGSILMLKNKMSDFKDRPMKSMEFNKFGIYQTI